MDDPWGSPWASSDSVVPKPEPEPSTDNSLLCPPPRAFFGNTLTTPVHSPWADDGGFGDWASPAQADEPVTSSGWGPWGDSGLTPRAESPGRKSPIAWPSSAATSPGLKPTLRSRASTVFRQHSPDPWASESPWRELSVSPLPSRHLSLDSPIDTGISSSTDVTIQVAAPEAPEGSETHIESKNREEQDEGLHKSTPDVERDNASSLRASLDGPGAGLGLMVETDGHGSPSRPSSTFTVESDSYPDRQDSPTTSVDEDTRAHPSARPTTSSSRKVSDLVGMYDGLARAASEDPPDPERRGSTWVRDNEVEEKDETRPESADSAISGAYNDSASDGDSVAGPSSLVSSDRSSTPRTRFKDAFGAVNDAEKDEYHIPAPKSSSIPVQQFIEKFGVIKFTVDLSVIDKLFPDAPRLDGEESAASDVPDRIITDSFTTVGERKAWYRLSRYGSMRKHNSGDDENYHVVSWQSSDVHADTIKIVRRWMEEDSISGGPALGGNKRGSGFNWGSSTAPVNLEQVFARKSVVEHSRTSSTASPAHAASPSVGSLNSFVSRRKMSGDSMSITAPSPIPSFGWSSASPADSSSTISRFTTISSTVPKAPEQELKSQKIPRPLSVIPPPPTAAAQAPPAQNTKKPAEEKDDDEDDEDDWGEMVFSPVQKELTDLYEDTASSQDPGSGALIPKGPSSADGDTVQDSAPQKADVTPPITKAPSVDESQTIIASPHASVASDPWGSVDFSVFETPAAPAKASPIAEKPSVPAAGLQEFHPPEMAEGQQTETKSRSELPASNVSLGPIETSTDQQEAVIVRQIVQCLPNLTYMLR
jgi:hypothetical protein